MGVLARLVAAALVAAFGLIACASRGAGPGRPPLTSAPPSGGTEAASLVLRDGDTAQAAGIVVARSGQPTEFCPDMPQPVAALGPTRPAAPRGLPPCNGLGITVVGVDLSRLADRYTSAGTTTGQATLRRVYRGGVMRVTAQSAPPVPSGGPDLPAFLREPPCAPPTGGWRGPIDTNAVRAYVDQHPDRFNGLGVTRPKNRPATEVTVVGVAGAGVAASQAELRQRFGANICAVAVEYAATAQRRTEQAVLPLMHDRANGIWAVLGGPGQFQRVTIELTVLSPVLYTKLAAIGLADLEVEPWLKPVG